MLTRKAFILNKRLVLEFEENRLSIYRYDVRFFSLRINDVHTSHVFLKDFEYSIHIYGNFFIDPLIYKHPISFILNCLKWIHGRHFFFLPLNILTKEDSTYNIMHQ